MRKRMTKLMGITLAMLLVLMTALPAFAETLTVHFKQDESVPEAQRFTFGQEAVQLSAYLIATGSYGYWEKLPVYSDIEIFDRNGGFLKTCMGEIRTRITEQDINPVASAVTKSAGGLNGIAEFNVVDDGMYFVIQTGSSVLKDDQTTRVVRTSDMMLATNGADDVNAKWLYTVTPNNPHKLTIVYIDENGNRIEQDRDGQPSKDDYIDILWEGATYSVPSPKWYGHADGTYTISIKIVKGTMPDHDLYFEVVYIPIRRGTHEIIPDYRTALGLGNIQMHVGVCFE